MKRKDALTTIRVAGYHGDQRTYLRTYTEHRISMAAAQAEYQRGQRMKKDGVPCSCQECNK